MGDVEENKTLVSQLLPKTLAGLALWLLIFAMGMAASGVVLFAYYQFNLATLRQDMNEFSKDFEKQFKEKSDAFDKQVKDSKAEIEKAAQGAGSQTNEVSRLLERIGPSIAYVAGADAAGAPGGASGFIVSATNSESWVLTVFKPVAGSAAQKSAVRVRIGSTDREGTVWSWDEGRDLALVIIKVGNLPVLEWEKNDPPVGSLIWAVGAAPGKLRAAASQGYVLDNGQDGYLVDADVANSSAGGPLITREAKVLGVLSINYAPGGYPSSKGWVVPIKLACQKVLRCP